MFSIQQIANVWVHFFNESLQNILSQEVSLVQLSQKLEQLVNQTGGEVLKAILEQADKAIYAASKPEHRYQVKAHRSRTLTTLWGEVTFTRTYYQDKTDSSYHYLLDEWLGLDKSTKAPRTAYFFWMGNSVPVMASCKSVYPTDIWDRTDARSRD